MIQPGSKIHVADNSGARIIECITVLGGCKRDQAEIGNIISASVKSAAPHGQIKKKAVIKAVIVRQRKPYQRKDGSTIRFDENAAVIIDDNKLPAGTRIFGPVTRELRDYGYQKIVSLAQEVL